MECEGRTFGMKLWEAEVRGGFSFRVTQEELTVSLAESSSGSGRSAPWARDAGGAACLFLVGAGRTGSASPILREASFGTLHWRHKHR